MVPKPEPEGLTKMESWMEVILDLEKRKREVKPCSVPHAGHTLSEQHTVQK